MGAAPSTVLALNAGSSSVKYELFSVGARESPVTPLFTGEAASDTTASREVAERVFADLGAAGRLGDRERLAAIGHRVVHGAGLFDGPALIDEDVFGRIRSLAPLAPLHIEAALAGVTAAREACPGVPNVAVFDTSFHRALPAHAREYALPRALAREHGIHRYGFHGISHGYVASRAAAMLGRPLSEVDLITLHLGNGASAAAIRGGVSIDTSMGMTPLEGLMMGTRCGDVDPAVPLLIAGRAGMSADEVHRMLTYESGLLGVCGTRDMREVHALVGSGDADAALALEMFCYRVRKHIGSYCAALGGVDAIVFTAGIGENDPVVRARVCEGLGFLGVALDPERNAAPATGERAISAPDSRVSVLVIPTDEEAEVARLAYALVRETVDPKE